ncbi:spore germination lipoprotein GerD [Heyndrickxia acidicola]|uniref:Spore germination lipoprotein GerD n=1 Tax=Heyndrickxia acidicola TaxID=209389 RepID=A0ABU6MRE3_9BACI|nr:spore germination lipoprotein GerD [Heyndrickxia acidicola]MED1205620.1 spore germination lipoprotein GerD [Heyndrickxia acidicola]
MKKKSALLLFTLVFILSACAGASSSGQPMDYDQTKKMMVDILKTDDGKKAIKDIMTDSQLKQELIMDQAVVTDTIKNTLTSEKGTEFWKKAFNDPKFSEAMAKGMKTENEALLKKLMKDPDYQKMMLDILKDPDYQKTMASLLKSKDYRQYLQSSILETVDSPLFKTKLEDAISKSAKKPSEEQGKTQSTQGGGQGGPSGG